MNKREPRVHRRPPASTGCRRRNDTSTAGHSERTLLRELGKELRQARLAAGLSQTDLGRPAQISHAQVSRIERGKAKAVPLLDLSRLLSVAGLELSARAYPAGDALRDAAHERLLERFLGHVSPPLAWRREVPLPNPGDQRAWDALIMGEGDITAVEAEIRVTDFQALQRRLQLKLRDGRLERLILVVADSRRNRLSLREAANSLGASFPLSGQRVIDLIVAGRHPHESGYVLL